MCDNNYGTVDFKIPAQFVVGVGDRCSVSACPPPHSLVFDGFLQLDQVLLSVHCNPGQAHPDETKD